jgi:hypothetical protein
MLNISNTKIKLLSLARFSTFEFGKQTALQILNKIIAESIVGIVVLFYLGRKIFQEVAPDDFKTRSKTTIYSKSFWETRKMVCSRR